MKLNLSNKTIDVFSISPRTIDTNLYWKNIKDTTRLSQKYSFTGILIFTGNDIYIDPWLVAQYVLTSTSDLSPLVAVNPLYMHPFTAAKMISSFAYMYQRKTYVNCVTGTNKNDLTSLSDNLSPEERYKRLAEYICVVKKLLEENKPVNYNGNFYNVNQLQLLPKMPADLFPEFYIAGSSEAAKETAQQIGAVNMKMAKPVDEEFPVVADNIPIGVNFGIITRQEEDAAWKRVKEIFPQDAMGQQMQTFSMKNTDSNWKKELNQLAAKDHKNKNYWMDPFKNFKSDCPYYIGSHDQIADILVYYINTGVKSFILDIPPIEEEYMNINMAFQIALEKLRSNDYRNQERMNFNFKY